MKLYAYKVRSLIVCLALMLTQTATAQEWGKKVAETVMQQWAVNPPGDPKKTWAYDIGVILKGMEGLWITTGDGRYFKTIQERVDHYVQEDGTVRNYELDEYNIDHVNNGKLLLTLYKVTGKVKYKKAADLLRQQLRTHPRTKEGGFWHKKIYPYQMWLDGLYMGSPFYAEYAATFGEDTVFTDVCRQFIWMEKHARDPQTGLLYHGWDESREQAWANKETGCSPLFWGRAMGWYADGLVDALDHIPTNHPLRGELIAILNRLITALEKEQDPATGLWFDILHYEGPGKERNYLEASASAQYVYAITKGVRKGYLPASKADIATRAYAGILRHFIREENGMTHLDGTVKVSGLGGKPYRDGSFSYYMSEPVIRDDPKGVGAFLLASVEIEWLGTQEKAKGKTLLLDRYFNSEKRVGLNGKEYYWHYVWEERSNAGFSFLGGVAERFGASLASLDRAPTTKNLKGKDVYILVDPDHQKDNPSPNYVDKASIKAIQKWVKKGGVLWLMANDSANCELTQFNKLAEKFGMRFTSRSLNMVKNDAYEMGAIIPGVNPVFTTGQQFFLKEISELEIKAPANVLVNRNGQVIMAIASYGKGQVFAVGDPWLYNEYVDGRRLPAGFSNYAAMEELITWSLSIK